MPPLKVLKKEESISLLCKKWQIADLLVLAEGSLRSNYVARGYSGLYQKDSVLKIVVDDTCELESLKLYNGNGAVKLLDYDQQQKALLLEAVIPGTALTEFFPLRDREATIIVAQVIKKLQSLDLLAQAKNGKTVTDWLKQLYDCTSKKIPLTLLSKAQLVSKKLSQDTSKFCFLHGDLHSENILLRKDGKEGEWIIIDPKGVIGPLEWEIGRFIMNPISHLIEQENADVIIRQRIELLSELLTLDKQVVLDWLLVQAVLSACWAEEDGNLVSLHQFILLAEIVAKIDFYTHFLMYKRNLNKKE
jgi:streptomycin 6-kinase